MVRPLDESTFEVCWVPGDAGLDGVVARLPDGAGRPEVLGQVLAGQDCFTDSNAYPYTFEYWVKHVAGEDESDWARFGAGRGGQPAAHLFAAGVGAV